MYYTITGKFKPYPVNKITMDTRIEWTLLGQRLSEPPTHMLNYKLDCKKQCGAVGRYETIYLLEASCPTLYYHFIKFYSSTIVDFIVKIVMISPTS